MRAVCEIRKLGDILIFDKRFNGIPKEQQGKIAHFHHVSAEELKSLKVDDGDVKLISTGQFDGYTTVELAGGNLNRGEIITLPTGGVANIKYYTGLFVDSGNLIGIARDKSISLKYVYYGMTCKNKVINSYYRGVSIKHPFMPDICKITLPIPSVQQQEKIVAELDCLTGIIEKKKQQLEELDKLAQSIFYDMFGNPISNEKGWPYKSFGQLYDVKSSKRLYQSELSDRGVPFYKIADIVNLISGIKVVPISFVPTEKFSNLKHSGLVPQKGDILLTSRGTLGMCYIISADDEFYFQDGMITWFSNGVQDMTPVFVKYLFKNNEYNQYLLKHGNFTTVAYISINQLKGMLCPIPPLDIQNEFAQKIEAIEKQKELVKRSIVETETLFNSRMDYWFNN